MAQLAPLPQVNVGYAPVVAPTSYYTGSPVNSYINPQATGQPQQQSSGGGGFNLPSFGFGNNSPFSGITSGITNAVDTFGANLGFGAGRSVVGAAGPLQPVAGAGSLTSSSLSGVLGAAGLGSLGGGLIASLTGGNTTGGSIGGGAGAAIGNIIAPGIGGIVGGLLGGIGGSLFGGKKPSNKLQVGFVNLGTGQIDPEGKDKQSQTGKKFSAENGNLRDAISNAAAQTSQFLAANGAKAVGSPKLMLGVGSRDGYWYSNEDYNTPGDWESRQTKVDNANGLADGVFNSILKLQNASPELAAQAKQIYYQNLGGNSQVAQGGGSTTPSYSVPTVGGRRQDVNTFDNFVKQYKSKMNANAAPTA